MHIKDFQDWNKLKTNLHSKIANVHLFSEREIWWHSIGVNVGDEEDGHNNTYNRPVIIIKKFNRIFWGVPTTSQIKDNKFYLPIDFKDQKQCVMLSHLRLYDSKRLENKRGKLSNDQFTKVKYALKTLI